MPLSAQDTNNVQKKSLAQRFDGFVEKKSQEWAYNPFRRSNNEMNMVGRSNPWAFLTRFGIGALPSLGAALPAETLFQADRVILSMTPQIGSEINVIPFEIGRVKTRIGVAVSAEFHLLLFDKVRHFYGKNYILSDTIAVAPFVDLVIDDRWKLRWIPVLHQCSHYSGDFLGDPDIVSGTAFLDYGQESMGFELYYARPWVTAYIGTSFQVGTGAYASAYGNLFSAFVGFDLRVPMWGNLLFLFTSHLGLEVNIINIGADRERVGDIVEFVIGTPVTHLDPVAVVGAGVQIDRYSIVLRYAIFRSKHIPLFHMYEQRVGMDFALYF
ncbi:MAG: hypothetical protein ACRCY4_07490 [Brevinema sp.]